MFVKILPPEVRRKIAAGEVIEFPTDVVKELIENALDAGATRVEVEISKGGRRLIVVRDNGTGIHPEDVEKVILEGATSKIESERDLMNVRTFGFRGEALHSIASVSRLRIRSRHFQSVEGHEIEVEGGKVLFCRKVGMHVGTEVEVRDLFYNLPVRRKFLRKEDTERRRMVSLIKDYALASPEVGFYLFSNGKEILSLKPSGERERVEEVFGGRFTVVESEKEFLKVRAYIRRNVKQGSFHVFVNSRPVSVRNMKDFLRGVLGYKTIAVIFMELPPFLVDINIHPKKKEVRFVKERKILSLLREALSSEGRDFYLPHLAQEGEKYDTGFRILGQVNETLIIAKGGDYLYFFDQHLLSERINYEEYGREDLACRVSLKAGEFLSEEDMKKLLEKWRNLENPHVCPHGRPIYWRIHLKEIYEKLGRNF